MAAGAIKWTGDNIIAKNDVAEYDAKWTSTGMKQVHVDINGNVYNLHINIPETGTFNRDDPALVQQVGVLNYSTVAINGISARERVFLKYGVDGAHGGTRQDAIRHST